MKSNLSSKIIKKHIKNYNIDYYNHTKDCAVNSTANWTKKEDELVVKHIMSDRELALKLGRSQKAVQVRRHKLRKLHYSNKSYMHMHQYTEEELELICDPKNHLKDLAHKFNVSTSAIANMRYKYRMR